MQDQPNDSNGFLTLPRGVRLIDDIHNHDNLIVRDVNDYLNKIRLEKYKKKKVKKRWQFIGKATLKK